MEKDYTVKLYHFGKGSNKIFTITQLLKLAGTITGTTPFTDVKAAIEVVANDFKVPTYQVLEENLQLDIDDFVGNIRPDSHFAEKLDLDIFKNSVDQHSYFVKSFSNFSNDEKTIICKFIKKAINLYEYDDYVDDLFVFLRPKIKVVISTFVHKLFQTDDPRNIQNQLLQMEKFNSIELEELKDILIDVINEVSIKELATNNDKINSKLADDFQHQIVIANTKKV